MSEDGETKYGRVIRTTRYDFTAEDGGARPRGVYRVRWLLFVFLFGRPVRYRPPSCLPETSSCGTRTAITNPARAYYYYIIPGHELVGLSGGFFVFFFIYFACRARTPTIKRHGETDTISRRGLRWREGLPDTREIRPLVP